MTTATRSTAVTRCTKCVMPSSVPGSDFNSDGECAWCRSGFPNYTPRGDSALRLMLDTHRSHGRAADCLVGVSGGKDSSYALLELRRTFGMRVEAFTYTHDGLEPFALENARVVCRALDVKHHTVSLPDHTHLQSFKAYFCAWLEDEEPVSAAMTCVACKHLHVLGLRLAQERSIPMVIWSVCPLEDPPFVPTQLASSNQSRQRGLVDLGVTFLKRIYRQPEFRAAFLSDMGMSTVGCLAFRPDNRYLRLRYPTVTQLQFFDYVNWDGNRIRATLQEQTAWSVPDSAGPDWHSDCAFNVFKEYMFQRMLGASYTDGFLSNQIRHGLMTRDAAWQQLIESKAHFSRELMRTLTRLDLDHLRSRVDPGCFEVDGSAAGR